MNDAKGERPKITYGGPPQPEVGLGNVTPESLAQLEREILSLERYVAGLKEKYRQGEEWLKQNPADGG